MFLYIWLGGLLLCAILVTIQLSKQKKPWRAALLSALSGIALLMMINVLQSATGFSLPVNYVTVSIAVVLGPPGAVLLLFLNLLA